MVVQEWERSAVAVELGDEARDGGAAGGLHRAERKVAREASLTELDNRQH
jgi:hypothetical protein